jgi:hypothetical protein
VQFHAFLSWFYFYRLIETGLIRPLRSSTRFPAAPIFLSIVITGAV